MHDLLAQIVKAKPRQVFLDSIRVSPDSLIIVEGKAETKDAVFEFEASLKSVPLLKSPRVESTRHDRLPTTDTATGFTIKAKFADSRAKLSKGDKHD